MRAIPGTITEYGIENRLQAERDKLDNAPVYAVTVTRGGDVLRVITGEHGTPLTLNEARDIIDAGNLVVAGSKYSLISLR